MFMTVSEIAVELGLSYKTVSTEIKKDVIWERSQMVRMECALGYLARSYRRFRREDASEFIKRMKDKRAPQIRPGTLELEHAEMFRQHLAEAIQGYAAQQSPERAQVHFDRLADYDERLKSYSDCDYWQKLDEYEGLRMLQFELADRYSLEPFL
jgi:predicted transcriptional regulator